MKKVIATTFAFFMFGTLLIPAVSNAADPYRFPGMMCKPQDTGKYERGNYDQGRFYNKYNGTTNIVCPVVRKGYGDPQNGQSNAFYIQGQNSSGTTRCRVEARDYDGSSLFASSWKTKSSSGLINFYWPASSLSSIAQYDHVYVYCEAGAYAKITQYMVFW
jgi:hypothetical protein